MPKRIFTLDDLATLSPDFSFSQLSVANHFLKPYYLSLTKSYSGYNKTLFVFRPLIDGPEVESICPTGFDFPLLKSVTPQMLLEKAQTFYAELTSNFSSILDAYLASLSPPVHPGHQGRPLAISSSLRLCPILYECLLPAGSGEPHPQYYLARIDDLAHVNYGKWALFTSDRTLVPPLNIPADAVIFTSRKDAFHALQERLQSLGHLIMVM
jgi:hypothetical protein